QPGTPGQADRGYSPRTRRGYCQTRPAVRVVTSDRAGTGRTLRRESGDDERGPAYPRDERTGPGASGSRRRIAGGGGGRSRVWWFRRLLGADEAHGGLGVAVGAGDPRANDGRAWGTTPGRVSAARRVCGDRAAPGSGAAGLQRVD